MKKPATDMVRVLIIACIIINAIAIVEFIIEREWKLIVPYITICILWGVILKQALLNKNLLRWCQILEKAYGKLTAGYLHEKGIEPDNAPSHIVLTNVKKVEL